MSGEIQKVLIAFHFGLDKNAFLLFITEFSLFKEPKKLSFVTLALPHFLDKPFGC